MARHLFSLAVLLPLAYSWVRDNDVGRLPALGWNSWNAYHCDIDAKKLMDAAHALVDKGFKDAGYIYLNSDDCWSNHNGRDNTTNRLLPNMTKFPEGIKGVADKVHDMGLKFGIYSTAGTLTCGGYPASLGYEKIDAATFAEWGVDYLKYDNCNVPGYYTDDCFACLPDGDSSLFNNGTCTKKSGQSHLCSDEWPHDHVNYTSKLTALRFRIMQDALAEQDRTILYSLCEWGVDQPWRWANSTANSWRTTGDIYPEWIRIAQILNFNSFLGEWDDFWGHNDPDMLEIGNGNLTVEERRSHFAFWAIMKSPLLIGTNLVNITKENADILQNKHLLAFNQDPEMGKPAQPYKWGVNPDYTFNSTCPAEFWSGSYSGGTLVAMLNSLNETRTMTADFSEVPQLKSGGKYKVTDAWTGKSLGCKQGKVSMKLEQHDTAVLVLQDSC